MRAGMTATERRWRSIGRAGRPASKIAHATVGIGVGVGVGGGVGTVIGVPDPPPPPPHAVTNNAAAAAANKSKNVVKSIRCLIIIQNIGFRPAAAFN